MQNTSNNKVEIKRGALANNFVFIYFTQMEGNR